MKNEVARNVGAPMAWYATVRRLAALGIRRVCECGASEALTERLRRDLPGALTICEIGSPAKAPGEENPSIPRAPSRIHG